MVDAKCLAFDQLSVATRGSLLQLAADVGYVPVPEIEIVDFQSLTLLPDIEPTELTQRVDAWVRQGSRFIYFLDTVANAESLLRVSSSFVAAKSEERDDRAYARANNCCQTLYVGSSSSLGRRFREHLGYGARGTYALHMSQWAPTLDLQVRFVAARYPATVRAELLGLLEDQLWDQLKPMFGRKGRR
jgi:hypothetical protein